MKVLLSIGMPIYLLVEGSVVVMTSLEPKKVESCARDRALGQLGAFLFYLSDVVLLCGMCLPYGIILRDFLVMLTYYSGQFLLAYGTRQWSSFNAKLPLKGDEDRIRLSTNTEPTYSKDVEQGYILWAASDPALLKQFNFKGFANEKYNYNTTLEGMLFEFNFLRPLVNTKCTQADCVASKIQNNNCVCLGENSTVQWDEIPNNNGIFFTFESKDFMVSYKLTLQITCGKTNTLEIADPYTNTHVWTYPSKYGCRAGGGLGWGWVFIIILFSSLALFFIIGIPINKCGRKKSGIEVVPFGYFWVGIPRMVMEGVKCLFSPCRKRQRGFEAMD
ncbi:hypothetical protein BLNAU_24810 [Blattamonas nauphoetae]|uniref:Uncharacterized protein n=1 Tax=Blattamonas nauphoetae TaxID=2049346 RepID=A0ABQ9WM84_9EUKA|nr:hypothetical protein BLNAU_24810 [Blattamonas nauphoetae]